MNSRQRFGVAAALVVVSAAVSVLAAPELPARMATHWNAAGEPDGYVDEAVALALLPTMLAVLLVAFAAVPRVDPLAENIAQFRAAYDWFVVAVTGFLLLVHVGIVAYNLGYEFDVTLAVLGATALLFYGVGLLLERVERNWFVGIRTPWTLSSDEVWERTNRLGGAPVQTERRRRTRRPRVRRLRGVLPPRAGAGDGARDGRVLLRPLSPPERRRADGTRRGRLSARHGTGRGVPRRLRRRVTPHNAVGGGRPSGRSAELRWWRRGSHSCPTLRRGHAPDAPSPRRTRRTPTPPAARRSAA